MSLNDHLGIDEIMYKQCCTRLCQNLCHVKCMIYMYVVISQVCPQRICQLVVWSSPKLKSCPHPLSQVFVVYHWAANSLFVEDIIDRTDGMTTLCSVDKSVGWGISLIAALIRLSDGYFSVWAYSGFWYFSRGRHHTPSFLRDILTHSLPCISSRELWAV